MEIPEFKRGDVGDKLTGTVNMDLTGFAVRLIARRLYVEGESFDLTVDDAESDLPEGVVVHVMDGTLPVGRYETEIEVTKTGSGPFTFPTSPDLPRFDVHQDLG